MSKAKHHSYLIGVHNPQDITFLAVAYGAECKVRYANSCVFQVPSSFVSRLKKYCEDLNIEFSKMVTTGTPSKPSKPTVECSCCGATVFKHFYSLIGPICRRCVRNAYEGTREVVTYYDITYETRPFSDLKSEI